MNPRLKKKVVGTFLRKWVDGLNWPIRPSDVAITARGGTPDVDVTVRIPLGRKSDREWREAPALVVRVIELRGRWALQGGFSVRDPSTNKPILLFRLQRGSFKEIAGFLKATMPRGLSLGQLMFEKLKSTMSTQELMHGVPGNAKIDHQRRALRKIALNLAAKFSSVGRHLRGASGVSGDVAGRMQRRAAANPVDTAALDRAQQELIYALKELDDLFKSREFRSDTVDSVYVAYLVRAIRRLAQALHQLENTTGVQIDSHVDDIREIIFRIQTDTSAYPSKKALLYKAGLAKRAALKAFKQAAEQLKRARS